MSVTMIIVVGSTAIPKSVRVRTSFLFFEYRQNIEANKYLCQ